VDKILTGENIELVDFRISRERLQMVNL